MKNKFLVLGLGVSGLAVAEFLLKNGKAVIGLDNNLGHLQSSPDVCRLREIGLQVLEDEKSIKWDEIEYLVVSPGVSRSHPIYQLAIKKEVKVTSEAELALVHFQKPLVAVTGTNGKTTVTLLTEHVLNSSGIKTKALGNVGTPLCTELLHPTSNDAFVVELSSFQLETMQTPVFNAAVLLNITPDHLDRYTDMQDYARAKFRLQFLLKDQAPFFVQAQTAKEFPLLFQHKNYQTFGVDNPCDLYTDKTNVYFRKNIEFLFPLQYRDLGAHDYENALAAWILCRPFSISNEQFCTALSTFRKPPHRIEFVKEIEGISFYDDSKGTNIDAVIQAVKAMKRSVILIAGGVDKGASYLPWKEHFLGKVKQIIVIGQAAPKIYSELHPYFNIKLADSLASAVDAAVNSAVKGDTVLLSPGCSSYDMFRDYAHRGREFQRFVQNIEGRRGT